MLEPIAILKEKEQAQTPLLLLDVTYPDGAVFRWATHAAIWSSQQYEARVLRHNFFEIQAMSEQGTDQIPRLTVVLANADSQMSQLEQNKGFKGATLAATFVFYDLLAGEAGPDSLVVFSGYCNPPDEVSDLELKVTALNRMNMQRVLLPPVKIQRRCPWRFPATAVERQAAVFDSNSLFYACGYSPDIPGGRGRFATGTLCYDSCTFSRQACIQRGMFNHDASTSLVASANAGATSMLVSADIAAAGDTIDVGGGADPQFAFAAQEEVRVTGKDGAGPFVLYVSPALRSHHGAGEAVGRVTRRFGGIEFVPEAVEVRPFGSPFLVRSAVYGTPARYNDHIPLVYGPAWVEPVITLLRNDGNLTRMEAIVSLGRIDAVERVVVNDFEIPAAIPGRDMTGSGWYSLVTDGSPYGGFDLNFTDRQGNPQGDPYGSIAYLSIVVPNKVNDGKSIPRAQLLVRGRLVETFSPQGVSLGYSFSNNTAWVLLDLLKMARWKLEQINLPSFTEAAAFCSALIPATDNNGNAITVPRFQCNLVARQRRTAAEIIQGVRNNARLYFTYSSDGKLQATVENTIGLQQPALPYGSNATAPIAQGWPAYVYSDSNGTIVRHSDGDSSLRVFHRPITDTPNRFAFEFQDAFNQYVQDSFAVDDVDDQTAIGQEISQTLVVEGIPSFDQAARIAKFHLDKSVKGNTLVEFETSVKALGQQVGQIIAITYAREGWTNQLFRILRLAPRQNYRTVQITAQIHDDAWYSDANGSSGAAGVRPRQPRRNPRPPNPLMGVQPRPDGDMDWAIAETPAEADGTGVVDLSVGFAVPSNSVSARVGPPTADPVATVQPAGGSLAGGQTLFYRLTATDASQQESAASFFIRANVPEGTNTNAVALTGQRFDASTTAFNVYRGSTPSKMCRIAVGQLPGPAFLDTGLPAEPVPVPDIYFDHANFYWKRRLTAPAAADIQTSTSIGNSELTMADDEWSGCLVRIAEGTGAGQLRVISSNTATTLAVQPAWMVMPSAGSIFFVEEPDWKLGSSAASSPATFRVPNCKDATLLVQGRAADEQNSESPEALATVTAWTIGGVGPGVSDRGLPPPPAFGVAAPRDGTLVLGPISFGTLANTGGITSATYQVHYADEINGAVTAVAQGEGIGPGDLAFSVASSAGFAASEFTAIEEEVMRIEQIAGQTWTVSRGWNGTQAAAHPTGARIDRLVSKVFVYPLERAFFGSAPSGKWSGSINLPYARVAGVQLSVANGFGDGPATVNNYLDCNSDPGLPGSRPGLRTNRGGQFTFQLQGRLVIENEPTSPLAVHLPASVRDLYALVRDAPAGAPIRLLVKRNGAAYQALEIAAGATISAVVSGASLPALSSGDLLSFDVQAIGSSEPGRDLTLVIRI